MLGDWELVEKITTGFIVDAKITSLHIILSIFINKIPDYFQKSTQVF